MLTIRKSRRVDDADNVDQVLMIQQALVGAPFGVKAERRLVLQGQLSRVVVNSRSTGEERTYFLFSDLLVFVRPKQDGKRTILQYKGHLNLERARVKALSSEEAGGQEHCIEITSSFQGVDTLNTTYMGTPTVHVLQAHSREEQQEWLKQLEAVIVKLDRTVKTKACKLISVQCRLWFAKYPFTVAANRRMQQNRSPNNDGSLRRIGTASSSRSSTSGTSAGAESRRSSSSSRH